MTKRKKNDPSQGKTILVNTGPVENRIAIIDKGKLADFNIEREGLEHYAGSVYKGKVSSIVKGIEAAFIEIGLEKNGFLHVSDVMNKDAILRAMLPGEDGPEERKKNSPTREKINEVLKVGEDLMVQVVKEALGTKGSRLTTYVSIPGRYVVLTPYDKHVGISRRIKDRDKRNKIRETIDKIKPDPNIGCIVRTMAEEITEKELKEEMHYLAGLWKRIKVRSETNKSPIRVYEEYGAVLRMVRDKFTDDVERLIVDSKDEYGRIMKFLKAFRPALRKKVELYKGQIPLFQKFDIEKDIDSIFERKVALKSGGDIVIEQTEGLVAIDVNTGSYTGKKNLEETAYKTNLEAAREIPRQLLLRDVGGIVIIDFIDMEVRSHRESIFNCLQQELKSDKARISVRSISQFGIVEMTRQRMRKSLESTSHVECPHCRGKGNIKSSETLAIEAARDIDKALSDMAGRKKHITCTVHPEVHEALISDQAKILRDIQRKYRCKIVLVEDKTLFREEVLIVRK